MTSTSPQRTSPTLEDAANCKEFATRLSRLVSSGPATISEVVKYYAEALQEEALKPNPNKEAMKSNAQMMDVLVNDVVIILRDRVLPTMGAILFLCDKYK